MDSMLDDGVGGLKLLSAFHTRGEKAFDGVFTSIGVEYQDGYDGDDDQ